VLVGRGPQAQANAGAASTKAAIRPVKNNAVKTFFMFSLLPPNAAAAGVSEAEGLPVQKKA
jgi:hypothetical protein